MGGPSAYFGPRSKPKVERVYINLGRTGDAIASVPLCYLYWKETGKKCALMVARQFSGFLEGISYIVPEIWEGDFRDVPGAMRMCRNNGYKEVINAQIYGNGIRVGRKTSSFILESWLQVGKLEHWDNVPMIFDRRDYNREYILSVQLPKGKPVVLVAMSGHSAPFPWPDLLMKTLQEHVGSRAHIVDLEMFKAHRFHDFLGLFDRAACLVTCDTAFGQLACASKVPVCALIAYLPTTWHSSPRRKQHVSYIRYNEFNERKGEMLAAIDQCLSGALPVKLPVIHHVWSGISSKPDTLRRMATARSTWDREAAVYGKWVEHQLEDKDIKRSAQDIGDPVMLPYIHDLMDYAGDIPDDDIIVLSNADISFVDGFAHEVADKCSRYGSLYCYRWDFPLVVTHPSREYIRKNAKWYIGCDTVAVTGKWWRENKAKLPPFFIGRECWDWAFRLLIDETGGTKIEVGIYHEKHESPWEVNRDLDGNIWNRSYLRLFLIQRGLPWHEINSTTFSPTITWP